jgi:hypothetical protein
MARRRPGAGNGATGEPSSWKAPVLSSRHRATLAMLFERPTRADVTWNAFASLIGALGGEITNGAGSRRRIKLGPRRASLHEPHPGPNMVKGAVEDARAFLRTLGVSP